MNKIIAIVAIGKNREIGTKGKLPWSSDSYRDDMLYFMRATKGKDKIGHPCVMSIPSFQSIQEQYRPLEGRPNIVVSRRTREELKIDPSVKLPDEVLLAKSEEEAIHKAGQLNGSDQIFICGGRRLYEWAIEHADELWITEIPEEFPEADAFFPEFINSGWIETERTTSPNNQCTFVKYTKNR